MSGRGRPLSRSRRGEPPPPRAGAEEAKGSEEEDVEQVSAQAETAAHGMAAAASPNIEDVIPLLSLSETQRQTIVEIVSLFPSLSELQLKSIETLVVSPYLQKQSWLAARAQRSAHAVRLRFLQELVVNKEVEFKYCPTDVQLADVFTKPLDSDKFVRFRDALVTP
jgi:hypothetical protein